MSVKNQTVILIILFFISFIYLRGFLYGIKRYQLNKSAYKKRKKGESFKEWLFYSRYKEEIPKTLRVLYYVVLIIHPACLITCLFAYIMTLTLDFGEGLTIFVMGFDFVWLTVIALLFWSSGRNYAYERWITKKRGMRRKK